MEVISDIRPFRGPTRRSKGRYAIKLRSTPDLERNDRFQPKTATNRLDLLPNLVTDITPDGSTAHGAETATASEDGAGHRAYSSAGNRVSVTCRQIGATAGTHGDHDD